MIDEKDFPEMPAVPDETPEITSDAPEVPATGPSTAGPRTSVVGTGKMSPGYGLKQDHFEIVLDGQTYKNGNLTHAVMLTLMKRDPKWFRQSVVRRFYSASDPYWQESK